MNRQQRRQAERQAKKFEVITSASRRKDLNLRDVSNEQAAAEVQANTSDLPLVETENCYVIRSKELQQMHKDFYQSSTKGEACRRLAEMATFCEVRGVKTSLIIEWGMYQLDRLFNERKLAMN